jgi:hypothetical protein
MECGNGSNKLSGLKKRGKMNINEDTKITKIRSLLEAINSCRANVLDTIQVELGDQPNWSYVRSRLLRCFGDQGLTGRALEIFAEKSLHTQNKNHGAHSR